MLLIVALNHSRDMGHGQIPSMKIHSWNWDIWKFTALKFAVTAAGSCFSRTPNGITHPACQDMEQNRPQIALHLGRFPLINYYRANLIASDPAESRIWQNF